MKVASHNSLTYLPPLFAPFALISPFWRCQCDSITTQFDAGCRLFDIRVAFDRAGNPYPCHGIIRLKGDVLWYLDLLNMLASTIDERVYVRVVLEHGDDDVHGCFRRFCRDIVSRENNLTFFGGVAKNGWRTLYSFSEIESLCADAYGSFHDGKQHPWQGLFPKRWARKNNRKAREEYSDRPIHLMQDFITIY